MYQINKKILFLISTILVLILLFCVKTNEEKDLEEQVRNLIFLNEFLFGKPKCYSNEPLYLKGIIRDKNSGNRLDNVSVESDPVSVSKITDSLGKYEITNNLYCVYYVLTLSKTGYKTKKVNQAASNDDETEQETQLTPCYTETECAEVEDETTIAAGTPINGGGAPDIVLKSCTIPIETHYTGETGILRGTDFAIQCNVSNYGGSTIDKFEAYAYVSNDSDISSDDNQLRTNGLNIFEVTINPGQSTDFTIYEAINDHNWEIYEPGKQYYLGVVATTSFCYSYSNCDRNINDASPGYEFNLIDERTDLIIESFNSPSSVTRGSNFSVDVSLKNIGNQSSHTYKSAHNVCVYLSSDSNVNSDDELLTTYEYQLNLDPGQSSGTFNISDANISTSFSTGTYYIGATISIHTQACEPYRYGTEYESNFNNNNSEVKEITVN